MRWTFMPHVCWSNSGKPQRLEWDGDLGTPPLVVDMGFSLPNAVPTLIDSTPSHQTRRFQREKSFWTP